MPDVMDPQLAAEQRHLDGTQAASECLIAALARDRRANGGVLRHAGATGAPAAWAAGRRE